MFTGFFIWTLLQIPVGVVNNLTTILVCRLLAGCFGAGPMTLISAIYADFWEPAERGTATAVYSAAVYIGPTLGMFSPLMVPPCVDSLNHSRSHLRQPAYRE